MLGIADLTADELSRMEELKHELLDLRDRAAFRSEATSSGQPKSMWHFPDGSPITLVCSRLPSELQPPQAYHKYINYVRFAELADLDALIEIYGAIKAYNPTSEVYIRASAGLDSAPCHESSGAHRRKDLGGCDPIVCSRIFPIPIESEDPGKRGVIAIRNSNGEKKEFAYTLVNGNVVEDADSTQRGESFGATVDADYLQRY